MRFSFSEDPRARRDLLSDWHDFTDSFRGSYLKQRAGGRDHFPDHRGGKSDLAVSRALVVTQHEISWQSLARASAIAGSPRENYENGSIQIHSSCMLMGARRRRLDRLRAGDLPFETDHCLWRYCKHSQCAHEKYYTSVRLRIAVVWAEKKVKVDSRLCSWLTWRFWSCNQF